MLVEYEIDEHLRFERLFWLNFVDGRDPEK